MIPLTPSDSLTTKGSHSNQAGWSPSALLLEAAADDDALMVKVIDAFGKDTDARIEQMRGALAASDFPNIRAEAHTIKGCARQMGAEAVGEACQELEIACGLQEASLIAARLNRVQELFDEIRGAMAAYSKSRRTKSSVTP
jgi:HPt (histidine-containing phosphotransfer) domain-containing protein